MIRPFDWPALSLEETSPPVSLEYERGVWGKVHGAPTDYRWIAQSPDFGRDRPDLERQLNLGAEDAPARFQAWRSLGDRYCAVTVYPSRAIDASRRRGFLEKQILEWRRPAHVPAALGALVLLPHAAEWTDEIWWESNAIQVLSQSGIHLNIADADHRPLPVDENRLAASIQHGRQTLCDAVSRQTLEQLYDQLLSGHRPACLPGLQQPLPAEAIAALLLPLPRDIADRVSFAGWIPSSRPSLTELGTRWDILVTAPDQIVPSFSSRSQLDARRMVDALFEGDAPIARAVERPAVAPIIEEIADTPPSAPPFRPGVELKLSPPESNAAPIVRCLYDFAVAPDRRWLTPATLAVQARREMQVKRESARILCDWVRQVKDQRPPHADHRQWQIKIDLLQSAAIVLVPEPATLDSVGRPDAKSHVPSLLFGLMFDTVKEWDRLAGFGADALRQLLEQSLTCAGAPTWSARMRPWLERWQIDSQRRDVTVRALIREALTSCPP
jgi:hypothetical protein